jgi:hypothetical protein
MRRVHPLMKDANDRDAVVSDAEINHMPLDIAATIGLGEYDCTLERTSALRPTLGMPRSTLEGVRIEAL